MQLSQVSESKFRVVDPAGRPETEVKNRGRVWSTVFSLLLAGVLLYFSLRGVDWRAVWGTVTGAHWGYLAAAAGLSTLAYFGRALRWRILLNAETSLGVAAVFWANMAGYLGNNFLPARAGELVRSYLISSRSGLSKTYVLTTALSERLMDAFALVLASSLVLLQVDSKPKWINDVSGTMAIVAGLGIVAVVVLPHTGRFSLMLLEKVPFPSALRPRLLHLVEHTLRGLRAFHDWTRLMGFVSLTGFIWMADVLGAIGCARALGLSMTFPAALLLLSGLGLGSSLPSTPGYVGIYQFIAVSILPLFGIGRDQALAYILVSQAIGYVVITAWGLPGLYISKKQNRSFQPRHH
jgi:glycosyltransferase 2 family protein